MKYSPTQSNPRVTYIFASLLLFGGVTYAVPIICEANGVNIYAIPFTVFTLAAVVAAIYLMIRYRMTSFTYIIRLKDDTADGDADGLEKAYASDASIYSLSPDMLDFCVYKASGSRLAAMECLLSLSDLVFVSDVYRKGGEGKPTREDIRQKYSVRGDYTFYDYTLTLGLEPALMLVFIDGTRYVGIIIEPNEEMRTYLTQLKK